MPVQRLRRIEETITVDPISINGCGATSTSLSEGDSVTFTANTQNIENDTYRAEIAWFLNGQQIDAQFFEYGAFQIRDVESLSFSHSELVNLAGGTGTFDLEAEVVGVQDI